MLAATIAQSITRALEAAADSDEFDCQVCGSPTHDALVHDDDPWTAA